MRSSSAPFAYNSFSLLSIYSSSGLLYGFSSSYFLKKFCFIGSYGFSTVFTAFSSFPSPYCCSRLLINDSIQALYFSAQLSQVCATFFVGSDMQCRNIIIIRKLKIKMGFEELRYILTAFRTKKTYLAFHIFQLLLSVAIIITALSSKAHFKTPIVLILELVLFLTLAFDLFVVRWISEGKLCHRRLNIFDLGLLCIFAATLSFLAYYSGQQNDDRDYREIVQTDDIIILVIVIGRYVGQVISLVLTIKDSRQNRQIHKEIKNIDLNNIDFNHSTNFGEALKADQIVREKMKARHTLVEEL